MDAFTQWLENIAVEKDDRGINEAIKSHLTEYDTEGKVTYEPSEDDIFLTRLEHYAALRRGAYGSWQQQLDMQFSGTWQDHVTSVKKRFKKA